MQTGTSSKPPFPRVEIQTGRRAFVFGGAYGNLTATEAVLDKAFELGFSQNEIIFTGDSIAYCANPSETAELILSSGIHAIMGNCEEAIAQNAVDCGCGFEQGTMCDTLSQQWFNFCKNRIDDVTAEWMGGLPRNMVLEIGGFSLLCTHATPQSNNEFVFPSSLKAKADAITADNDFDGYVVGHSGIPFIGAVNGKCWINSGSSGMPANDGTSRIWYSIIGLDGEMLDAQTHALDYEFEESMTAMRSTGLNNGYKDCLETGTWPSDDVLPKTERAQIGVALSPQKKAFRRMPSLSNALNDA